ncbi:MAG: substrate binding domain-containing protein, partial [Candidatus Thiodiazotropha sp.]
TQEQIDLEIILSNRYEDMMTENIDVAIRIGPLKDSQLIAQFLFTSRFTLCAAKDFIAQLRGPIKTPQDLQQLPLLLLQQHNNQLEFTHKRTGQQMKPLFQPRICSNDIGVIRQAAVDGLGIACLPEISIRNQTRSGRLTALLSHYEIAHARDIYAVYPSKKYLSHKTRIFLDFVKTKCI